MTQKTVLCKTPAEQWLILCLLLPGLPQAEFLDQVKRKNKKKNQTAKTPKEHLTVQEMLLPLIVTAKSSRCEKTSPPGLSSNFVISRIKKKGRNHNNFSF